MNRRDQDQAALSGLPPGPVGLKRAFEFPILQEALTNVLKHAQARTVTVALQLADGALTLEVSDDGPGPAADKPASPGGRGRSNMAVRAKRLGGTLDIAFGPEGGRVSLRVPLASETPAGGA